MLLDERRMAFIGLGRKAGPRRVWHGVCFWRAALETRIAGEAVPGPRAVGRRHSTAPVVGSAARRTEPCAKLVERGVAGGGPHEGARVRGGVTGGGRLPRAGSLSGRGIPGCSSRR